MKIDFEINIKISKYIITISNGGGDYSGLDNVKSYLGGLIVIQNELT